MSVVSSVLSSRSSAWKINPRVASFMDSIFAIAFGLGLRLVVDAVSHHDFKLTGTIVGLWEGIILLHFLKKMPRSTDPYVAYAVRLFVDFLCTESVARLVLVLIWTGMGMVLADITPALWDDVGLNRIWRRFRRDLYTISRMIPTVAFFPPPRTVRFSPSREHSIIPEEPSILDSQPPSVVATEQTNTTPITIPATTASPAPAAQEILKRRVPGYFPGDYSDTDTDLGSPRARSPRAGPSTGRTSRRLSVYPQQLDYDESVTDLSSNNDLDEGNLSSDGSSVSTERAGPSSITFDTAVIPDMEVEEELVDISASVSNVEIPVKDEDHTTPRQAPMYLPPTPSDSAVRWGRPSLEPENEPLPTRPLSSLPQIPDFLEEPTTEDLEKMRPKEGEPESAAEEQQKPPTPPAKDDLPPRFAIPIPPVPTIPPPEPDEEWEILKSEFIVSDTSVTTTHDDHHHDQRQSLPPSYREHDEFDDIYGDEYVEPTLNDLNDMGPSMGGGGDLGAQESLIDDSIVSPLGPPFNFTFGQAASLNPWIRGATSAAADELAEFTRRQEEDGERQKKKLEDDAKAEADAAEKLREAEEKAAAIAAAKKAAEEVAERERLAEEEAKKARLAVEERERKEAEEKKKKEEKAERKRKEVADELARQQKRAEEEAETKRLADEEVARKAEEKKKKRKEEKAAAAAAKKAQEEAEAAKLAKETTAKKLEEDAAQRRKEAEEAETRREKARLEKEEKDKQDQEAREAEERRLTEERRLQTEEQERKQKEADDLAKGKALELKQQEAQKTAAEATKTIGSQPEGAQTQEAPTTTGEEAANATPTPTTKDLPQTPDANPANANVQMTSGSGKTPVPPPAELPPTSEPNPANAPTNGGPDDTITPETQGEVNQLEESPVHDDDGAESVVTEASVMPSDVGIRLQRLLLAKAQMIEVQDRIEELRQKLEDPEQDRTSVSEQLKASAKILKKMERKEQRRYEEGVAAHNLLDSSMDLPDSISYGTFGPKDVGLKTEEKLEELMRPGVKTLNVTLQAGKKGPGAKQKTKILEILEEYKLFDHTAQEGRTMIVDLQKEQFREWLIAYRTAQTASKDDYMSPW